MPITPEGGGGKLLMAVQIVRDQKFMDLCIFRRQPQLGKQVLQCVMSSSFHNDYRYLFWQPYFHGDYPNYSWAAPDSSRIIPAGLSEASQAFINRIQTLPF